MRIIRLLALMGFSLFLSACIEAKSDNGYWDKAGIDPAMVGTWITETKNDVYIVTDHKGEYLEARDLQDKLVLRLKTLKRGDKNYVLSQADPNYANGEILVAAYDIKGNKGTAYHIRIENPEVDKKFFPNHTDHSEFIRTVPKLDDATWGIIDAVYADSSMIKPGNVYQRCDQPCVDVFKKANGKKPE